MTTPWLRSLWRLWTLCPPCRQWRWPSTRSHTSQITHLPTSLPLLCCKWQLDLFSCSSQNTPEKSVLSHTTDQSGLGAEQSTKSDLQKIFVDLFPGISITIAYRAWAQDVLKVCTAWKHCEYLSWFWKAVENVFLSVILNSHKLCAIILKLFHSIILNLYVFTSPTLIQALWWLSMSYYQHLFNAVVFSTVTLSWSNLQTYLESGE